MKKLADLIFEALVWAYRLQGVWN